MRLPALLVAFLMLGLLPLLLPQAAGWAPGRNDYRIALSDGTVIDASMIVPAGTLPTARLPALVVIHGYGGSKAVGDAGIAAAHGYVGFAYSTPGFGKSTGKMDVAGPASLAALKELIAWLKANGPVDGAKVGVAGCSYGGGHTAQIATHPDAGIAAAAACVPWTDLLQALRPNHVFKLTYTSGFYLTGNGLVQSGDQPVDMELGGQQLGRRQLYDTYDPQVHVGYAAAVSGLFQGSIEQFARERSAILSVHNIRIPYMQIQGLSDDLFPGDQALPFFDLVPHQDKYLYLGFVGHPRAVASGAEVDHAYDQLFAFFDFYLKGTATRPFDPARPVEVASNPWDGTSLRLARFPAGEEGMAVALNPDGTLGAPGPAGPGLLANTLFAGAADDPVVPYADESAGAFLAAMPQGTPVDTLSFTSKPLTQATELLGTPRADLRLTVLGPSFQVAVKVYDVGPSGTTLVTRGIWGVPDSGPLPQHVIFDLQGYRHTFQPGHRVEVRLAAEDFPTYLPEKTPFALLLDLGRGGSFVRLPLSAALP